jgi:hypothetical protein
MSEIAMDEHCPGFGWTGEFKIRHSINEPGEISCLTDIVPSMNKRVKLQG